MLHVVRWMSPVLALVAALVLRPQVTVDAQAGQAPPTPPQQGTPPAGAPPQAGAPAPGARGGGRGNPAATLFTETCVPCHGADLAGGRAASLFHDRLLSTNDDDTLFRKIMEGTPNTAMVPFKGTLTDTQVWQLVAYIRTQAANLKDKPVFVPDPNNQIIKTQKQTFRIEVVTPGIETPWGLAFLPDGRVLVTERPGRLRVIEKGKLLPEAVKGLPAVHVQQDSGMLDVAVHPQYARNGFIYLSYTDIVPGYVAPPPPPPPDPAAPPPTGRGGRGGTPNPPSMTVVIRGKLNKANEWVESKEIFRAANNLYTPSGSHYGLRFTFDRQGHLFYTIGERGAMTNSQDLTNPLGKIHRVNDDGTVPADNPFVKTPGAVPTIWSYGHRNPQGLAWHPQTGDLWESEHGPTGGDEINVIDKGKNYGWGVISMGMQPGITKRTEPGMETPIVYYTPTIAPSGLAFYSGTQYPGWRNSLFVAALAGQQLRRLEIEGRKVISQEVVFEQFGRVRSVTTGPDGLLYVLLQNPTGAGTGLGLAASTPGMLIRLVPVK